MENKDLWNNFFESGKIEDYLKFKGENYTETEGMHFESDDNKRFDNQRTKGW
ncbi:MAG: hypothetical protein IIU65_00525 [Clostridia bacterium]|nr:hypothetical protein [Clostridia bacterium]